MKKYESILPGKGSLDKNVKTKDVLLTGKGTLVNKY